MARVIFQLLAVVALLVHDSLGEGGPNAWYAGLVRKVANDNIVPIPLQSVDINLDVKGWAVGVVAELTYVNNQRDAVESAFVFPIDATAAVYLLEATVSGRKIQGKVMERQQAQDLYAASRDSGMKSFLLENQQDDAMVYSLLIGNLPPNQVVKVKIGYAQPIDRNRKTGVLSFTIPVVLIPRHVTGGSLKDPNLIKNQFSLRSSWVGYSEQNYRMTFKGKVDLGGVGQLASVKVESPKDRLQVDISRSKFKATFSLTNTYVQDHDFTLLIEMASCLQPAVYIEPGLSSPVTETRDGNNDLFWNQYSVAGLWFDSFMAKIISNTTYSDEYWFILDRSRSMTDEDGGQRIEAAKAALLLFIKSLPSNSKFNVISFGGTNLARGFLPMFEEGAVPLNSANFNKAMSDIPKMQADIWGGTEMKPPFDFIYNKPTCAPNRRYIFLLTDGEISNTDEIIGLVGKNKANTRVFSIGVGNGADSALLEGVARVSNGATDRVTSSSLNKLQDKVLNMLTYTVGPSIDDVRVTWDVDVPAYVGLTTPAKIPASSLSGRKINQFALIQREADDVTIAGNVKLSGRVDGKVLESSMSFNAPGDLVSAPLDPMPLHRLAAKARLLDLVDEYNTFQRRQAKLNAIQLSIESGVLCEFTSLIAIDTVIDKPVGDGQCYDRATDNADAPTPVSDFEALMKAQNFDGSWNLSADLAAALKNNTLASGNDLRQAVLAAAQDVSIAGILLSASDAELGTLVALAALRSDHSERANAWEFVQEKAVAFLQQANSRYTDDIIRSITDKIVRAWRA